MADRDSTCGWKDFFDIYAPHYIKESFTRNTCAGNWGRRLLLMDEIELMVLARLDK